ncbi:DUF202 domain-containing protein [Oscillatoria sp. FACHB-1406]|nr:DUF202 domain-containing protein [Oscillatoria sp. FACHB-1406]
MRYPEIPHAPRSCFCLERDYGSALRGGSALSVTKISPVDRQREHQANERTFLAWLRTSIALMGFGFALTRFSLFLRQFQVATTHQAATHRSIFNSENLGLSLVIFGIVVIVLAAWHYNRVFWQIERGDYRPNRTMVWITTAAVIVLGLLSLPVLLWREVTPNPSVSPSQLPKDGQSF